MNRLTGAFGIHALRRCPYLAEFQISLGAVVTPAKRAQEGRVIPTLRSAESLLKELLLHVQPPRGCTIRLTERIASGAFEPNWSAAADKLEPLKLALYDQKVAELRKSDTKVDWSEVKVVGGSRSIARWLSEVELDER
jgi:hypothetical protein